MAVSPLLSTLCCLASCVTVAATAFTSAAAFSSHPAISYFPTSTVAATTRTSATASLVPTSTPGVNPSGAPLPPVGSIPRDFSPAGLHRLWDLVGPVEPPPFTTTRVPTTPIALPSPPPLLYPTWYAPQPKDIFPNLAFPKGFKFGVATAAYQVEGAAKSEGKGPTVWDWGPRQPGVVSDGTNGDIVDLQYFLYKEDTARIAALGVTHHSFSLSWARIFPFAVKGSPLNKAGLDHYSDVINYSLSVGVEPVVTLFHWDTPLAASLYYGGFTSPQIVDDFVNYATTVFNAYNGRVKTWYTFNEPHVFCGQVAGYPFDVSLAPGVNSSTATFHCSYNLLRAHAGAVKAFRAMNISGEIAFKNDGQVGMPWRANNSDDVLAVERGAAFGIGAFSTPVYISGDWPDLMKETLTPSFLPRFTEQEKKDLKGSADFFAIDAYTSQFIRAPSSGLDECISNIADPNWPACNQVVEFDSKAGWPSGPAADAGSPWLQASPLRLRFELREIHRRWPSKKIYISEFGFTQPFEGFRTELFRVLDDADRTTEPNVLPYVPSLRGPRVFADYFMTYLGEALRAIHEDGIPLAGTFAWAMIDNAEWGSGTSTRFGIQYVNYTSQERSYKRSAIALSEFFKAHLQ